MRIDKNTTIFVHLQSNSLNVLLADMMFFRFADGGEDTRLLFGFTRNGVCGVSAVAVPEFLKAGDSGGD